jgi:hypothetical protein
MAQYVFGSLLTVLSVNWLLTGLTLFHSYGQLVFFIYTYIFLMQMHQVLFPNEFLFVSLIL